jgi:hypothetical protein
MASRSNPPNPYNDLPTVCLLDQGGAHLDTVSQREAGRLLRWGLAELVLDVPPAVRLCIATADYQALSADAQPGNAGKGQFLSARRNALYGNIHFQHPHGQTMFHGDSEKALWYLNRRLVEVVSRDPPILRFQFPPGGTGHAGDDFYLAAKANRCVVCGAEEGLNRHHVVPSVYRRHLPAEVKDHSHHDVLLMCVACHEKYEREADRLKTELGQECGVPRHGKQGERDRRRSRAVKYAQTLVRQGEKIPPARKEEMLRVIAEWTGTGLPGDTEVAALSELASAGDDNERIEHGQQVIAQTEDVQAFVRRWREHFLSTMQPKFLPQHWGLDRPANREP